MAHIVLDKSYLQGASPDKIISLCDEHTVMMPDVLFYELTTTKEDSMRDCFNKFPNRDNPVELIPNIGSLLKYEWEMHKSCVPLYERRERITFRFNRRLREGRYQFQGKQLKAKESEMQVVDNKTVKKAWNQDQADNSLQLSLYSAVTGLDVQRLDLFVRGNPKAITTPGSRTKGPHIKEVKTMRSPQQLLWMVEVFRQVAIAISAGIFPPTAPDSWTCSAKWCGFWELCRGKLHGI